MTAAIAIPGVGVHDLTDEEYFAGPLAQASLSSTGVRELLVCPAKFRHNQQHPRPPKAVFDEGHAFHRLVLGKGPELVTVDFEEWRTKAVKELVADIRAAGKVPLKPSQMAMVDDMADALAAHPVAPKLLTGGEPEKTLIWVDEATGVLCRAKADWLRPDGVVDVKSCDKADTDSLSKSVWNWGYYIQAAFYLRGFRACFPGVEPFFAFIATEKDAPYLTQVFQLSDRALAYGDRRCTEALERYRDCTAADAWPGYPSDEIAEIDLPGWFRDEEYS
jgi:hypothetical protein